LGRPADFWLVRPTSIWMRSPGLVATQTLTFLFADIEGSATMSARPEDAWASA